MHSPLVRRHRLAMEFVAERDRAGLTQVDLAKKSKVARQTIYRLENSAGGVIKHETIGVLLTALGVTGDRWVELTSIAREAMTPGWWQLDEIKMGNRQERIADLEYGASSIRQYAPNMFPGLLQTEDFARAREQATMSHPANIQASAEDVITGRMRRQMFARHEGGPAYDVVFEEHMLCRTLVPPQIMKAQLLDIARLMEIGKVTFQILPSKSDLSHLWNITCGFQVFSYPDPLDPIVVTTDALFDDYLMLMGKTQLPFAEAYKGLQKAAMSPTDSLKYLIRAAEALPTP